MAEIKWIKLSVNMFDDEKIKLIRTMPEGDVISLIWIQMLCLAGKINDGGLVYMGQNLAYSDEMLATILGHPLNIMRAALKTLEQFEMIDIGDDGKIDISNWEKHQNIEGMERVKSGNAERQRVRYYRKKIKGLGYNPYGEDFPDDSGSLKEIFNDLNQKPHVRSHVSSRTRLEVEEEVEEEEDIDTSTSSGGEDELRKIYDFYQKNIGVIAPNTMEHLRDSLEIFGFEMVIHALTLTVDKQATYGYAKAIMERWLKNNIKTMDDVRAEEVAFQNRNSRNQNRRQPNHQEIIPSWANKPQGEAKPTDPEPVNNDVPTEEEVQELRQRMKEMGLE